MALQSTWFPGIFIELNWHPTKAPTDPGLLHDFVRNTNRDLMKICSYSIGKDLLELIEKRHRGVGTGGSGNDRRVRIRPQEVGKEGASTGAWTPSAAVRKGTFAGKGSQTIIYMHNHASSEEIYTRLAGMKTPTFIALAHELIHAFHHLSGTMYSEAIGGVKPDGSAVTMKREELFTTGIGAYANTRISENKLRAEANLPLRAHYYFPGDTRQVSSNVFGCCYV